MSLRISVIIGVLLGHLVGVLIPTAASAIGTNVIISGLQHASAAKATDEFVELTNPTSADISLAGWQMQYRSASSGTDCTKGWTTKATVAVGTIIAGGHYLLASTGYLAADATFASGLASAGTIRLLDASKTATDSLAWGAAGCATGLPAAAPLAGQSLERYAGAGGAHNDNATDFFVQNNPVAHSAAAEPTPSPTPSPTPTPSPSPIATPSPVPGLGSTPTAKLQLSELLIDPASPQTDAHDEFIEIHNAGADAVDVAGYAVQSGTHTFKLPKGQLAPDGYLVVTSAESTISLTNSGGVANLLDPAGNVIDTAGAWGTAIPGASWAFGEDTWRWTITPTPGAANIYTPLPAPASGSVLPPVDYSAVELSELLPDPAAPLSDANDEFIEIFNPNDQPVDVSGYVLKTGHDLTGTYVITGITIPAGGYVALKSAVTKLALNNVGSSVALYTPDGVQLGTTVTYPKAGTGNAWARLNGNWDWTTEPTPGGENIISPVAVVPPAAKAAKVSKAKPAVKAAATKIKAATKTKATKAPAQPLLAASTSTGGRWLLFILAGLTLAYIIYEFRYDLRNYYYQLRGYPVGRPALVPVPVGRGSDRADQRSRRR